MKQRCENDQCLIICAKRWLRKLHLAVSRELEVRGKQTNDFNSFPPSHPQYYENLVKPSTNILPRIDIYDVIVITTPVNAFESIGLAVNR